MFFLWVFKTILLYCFRLGRKDGVYYLELMLLCIIIN
jgi:hypothetical protein